MLPSSSPSKSTSAPAHRPRVAIRAEQSKAKADECPDEKNGDASASHASALLSSGDETDGVAAQPESRTDFIVWWDEPEDQDPENPLNWSPWVKWTNILTISVISFLV